MALFTEISKLTEAVRFSRIPTNGIHLHVAEAGPSNGPLVFLLHGFPEFWYGWRNQIQPLSARLTEPTTPGVIRSLPLKSST